MEARESDRGTGYKNPLVPKREKTKTYNMTEKALEDVAKTAQMEGYRTAIYICNAFYTVALLTVLRDKSGYGQVRLKRTHDDIQKLFGEIMEGRVSYEDLAQVLLDECNINLIVERPEGTPKDAMEIFRAAAESAKHRISMKIGKKKNEQ